MKSSTTRFAAIVLAVVAVFGSGLLRAELPQAVGTWTVGSSHAEERSGAAAVALTDGRTLILGGRTAEGPTASVVAYDPLTGSYASVGELSSARVGHTATLLDDGKVIVIGGTVNGAPSADVDVFDPATGSSIVAGSLAQARTDHAAARLADGQVLVVGGTTSDGTVLAAAELVDASRGSTAVLPAALHVARTGASATTLIDGRVLVAGGNDGASDLATAELFDPMLQTFSGTDTQLSTPRSHHTALLLPGNNGVLIAGGSTNAVSQQASDVFLPAIFPDPYSYGMGSFASTGPLVSARAGAVSGPAADGYAFVMGGSADGTEIYRFATIKTDKNDYAPGELAVISGSGWQAGEEVTLLFQEDPAVHTDYVIKVVADDSGRIYWDQWSPEAHDLGVRFYLTATDSKSRAQATFTDSNPGTITITPPTVAVSPGATAHYQVGLGFEGNDQVCTVTLSATGLPTGATAAFGSPTLSGKKNETASTSLDIGTSATTPGGTFTFTVSGTNGTGCNSNTKARTADLVVKSVDSVTVGVQTGNLTNGSAGNATYNVTVTRGAAGNAFAADLSVTTPLPVGATASFSPSTVSFSASDTSKTSTLTITTTASTPVGTTAFIVKANNSAAVGDFATGNGTLTVNPPCTAVSITGQPANQAVTYGENATFTAAANGDPSPAVQWQTSTNNGGSWNDVSGQTSTTLTLIRPSVSQSGNQYRAVFTNTCSGTQTATSNAATLTVAPKSVSPAITASNKEYDGNTTASITDRTLSGAISGDSVTLTGGVATFDTKNVGTGKTVTATDLSLSGPSAGNYQMSSTSATTTASITPKGATGSFTAASKTYDGNVTATIATLSLTGSVSGDDVSLTGGTAAFADKNVGTGKTVTGTGFSLSGADASNYALASSTLTTTADITQKHITGSFTAANKVYDGNTDATVLTRGLAGAIAPDAVSLMGGTAAFADKNVGMGKTVTLTGASLSGVDAGNYCLDSVATTTANITPRDLTVTATGQDKEYDGSADATVTLATDKVSGDDVTAGYSNASFADKNVGTAKAVTVSGISITGGDAGNYHLLNTTAATTANITQKHITGSFAAADKDYDGTTAATVTARNLTGLVGTDNVSLTGGTAAFADKNAGTAKIVTLTGATLSGDDSGNYCLDSVATTTATIRQRQLVVTATGINKVYDGTTAATVTLSAETVPGDIVNPAYASASFADKNVGTGKTVTVNGISISGTDAANYTTNTTASATAEITRRPLLVSATGVNKVYDGTTSATVTLSDNRVGGDTLTLAYASATFVDNKNVGTAKPVTVVGISVTGTDAGNYTFNTSAATTADITARPITVTADGKTKPYSAPDPPLTYQLTSGNLVGDDAFTGSLTRVAGEAVGSYAIGQGTLTAGSNYSITYVGANLVITAWTLVGFHQPVGIPNTVAGPPPAANPTGVWNVIKGGQTVPLKFNLYMTAGGTELTDVSAVKDFTLVRVACTLGVEDAVSDDFATSGNTTLRYDGLGGFFIQNWQSPKGANQCYRVSMTAADGSSLSAFFKTK